MAGLDFHNVDMKGKGAVGLARRVLRRLLLPIFERQVEVLAAICRRLDEGDAMNKALLARTDRINAKTDGINSKVDAINRKTDVLNEKADTINARIDTRFEEIQAQLAAARAREDELREEIASLVALEWDRTAIARRLAQLEDRLLGSGVRDEGVEPDHDTGEELRFPGFDRYEVPRDVPTPRNQAG